VRNVEANEAVEEDFDCCESERVCQRCNFREVCPFPQKTPFR
jgi:hypothetical protein